MNEVPGKLVLTVSNQDMFLQFVHLRVIILVTIGLCREIQDKRTEFVIVVEKKGTLHSIKKQYCKEVAIHQNRFHK